MLYKKCAELPLAIFIKIILEDNPVYLVKEGKHTPEEAAEAWANIYSEYFELSGFADYRHFINMASAVLIAENKIQIINACTTVLRYKHSEKLYKALERIGYPLKRIDNQEERGREIDKLISRAKTLVHTIASNQRELERMQQAGHKPTEQDYINTITSLSKWQGYRIDPELTTVAEFISIQKHYNTAVDYGKQGEHRRNYKQGGA